ncbi:hypothetical protein AB8B22_05515 [Leptotrichia sp. HSP-334]|uniref:DUF5105 domain-containing protein n=1 Tax=Leptotrichia rugosa TaxID=3239302 RepID=A0AB39VDR7_9FUSO
MKKILLGLFILGTLGMAQNNYEVYIKNGVNISQSEVDNDSNQIKGIVDKIISDFENRDKKIILEKFKIMIPREMKNDDDYKKSSAKDKEFYDRMNKIIADEMIKSLDKSVKYIPKSISFTGKNIAKVEITEIAPNFDSDSDINFNNALEKSGVTDEEMENLDHISDLSDQKKERFFKYLRDEIKKDLTETTVESRILEFRKINGKWQTKDELYEIPKI